jgi:hypothetical protein
VLAALSVVEQRLDAVRLVLGGRDGDRGGGAGGVSRQTLHSWLSRVSGRGGGRSGRPGPV